MERWSGKNNNRRVLHIYELVFKNGCIYSDFRNENFKHFQEFLSRNPPRIRSAKLPFPPPQKQQQQQQQQQQNILPSGTDTNGISLCFQNSPPWRAYIKTSLFVARKRGLRVDGRRILRKSLRFRKYPAVRVDGN